MAGIVAALILLERRAQNEERESRRNRSLVFNKRIRDMCDPYRDPNFSRTYRLTPNIALAMVRELVPVWRVHLRRSSLPAELKVCDSSLKILNVCAKYTGSTHDSFIWRFSAVRRRMMDINNQSNICWLLGDSGYPLEPWLLTPILNASPNTPENRYTTAHILSRNCIERCFGVLKSRFRCLKRKMEYDPQKVGCIVNACAVLHNVCIAAGLPLPEIVLEEDNLVVNTEERIRNRELYQRGPVVRQHLIERVFD